MYGCTLRIRMYNTDVLRTTQSSNPRQEERKEGKKGVRFSRSSFGGTAGCTPYFYSRPDSLVDGGR